DIVDAHGDQIDTDAVETAAVDGQAQFGADAIGTGNEYGAPIALDWQLEQAAEPAQAADDFRTACGGNAGADVVDELIAGINVHAGIGVGQGSTVSHVVLLRA